MEKYCDPIGGYGTPRFSNVQKLTTVIKKADKYGLVAHIHSIGDQATKVAMDAIADAEDETRDYDQRNELVHLQLVRPGDIERMAKYNVIAGVAPLWCPKSGGIYQQLEELYLDNPEEGIKRSDSCYPLQSFLDKDVRIPHRFSSF